jgi:UDP-2,4-diacetamido-2,4,6-trideoxy-beta-L-altropyranose hydrolase
MGLETILIRADASPEIGTGHVMRCLALAQAWQDCRGTAVFAMAQSTPAILERLAAEHCEVVSVDASVGSYEDGSCTAGLARQCAAGFFVLDGYHFDAEYQERMRSGAWKLMVVDDGGDCEYYTADVILNQNLTASESWYRRRRPHARLLLGAQYCMLRREFHSWRRWPREVRQVGYRTLITLGGSTPVDSGALIIEALTRINSEDFRATFVVGGSTPHFDSLQTMAALSGNKITLRRDARNMAELMANADVAISAAGSTCWELCFMGLPALLVDLASNQTPVARELDRRGCANHLANWQNLSPETVASELERLLQSQERRSLLSSRCQELVDGRGAERVISALRCATPDAAGSA